MDVEMKFIGINESLGEIGCSVCQRWFGIGQKLDSKNPTSSLSLNTCHPRLTTGERVRAEKTYPLVSTPADETHLEVEH